MAVTVKYRNDYAKPGTYATGFIYSEDYSKDSLIKKDDNYFDSEAEFKKFIIEINNSQ